MRKSILETCIKDYLKDKDFKMSHLIQNWPKVPLECALSSTSEYKVRTRSTTLACLVVLYPGDKYLVIA